MFDVITYALARGYTNAAISQAGGSKEIDVETISGTIPKDKLDELLKSDGNVIKCDNKIYRLSRIEGNNYKFMNSTTDGSGQVVNMTELDLDREAGANTIYAINSYQNDRRKQGVELGTNGKNDGTCGQKMWKDLIAL